jgi:uncharacterized membrane protein
MNPYLMYSLAFLIGGNIYCTVEILYRGRTHYSMFFCAGIAIIILLGVYVNNKNISLPLFAIISMVTITSLEFIFGVIFNIWLKMNVWDYSNTPLNLFGQICLPFSLIWLIFGIVIYYIFKLAKI